MNEPLYFDNLAVGDRWKSRGRTVTEADVVNFAGITGDYDPLHVDHEFARQTPFGKPIAHGLLGLTFLAGLGSHSPAIHTVAFVGIRQWDFRKPLLVGDTIYAVNEIVALEVNNRRRGRVTWKRQLVNHRGDVLQEGIFETLVARSTQRAERRDAAREERIPPPPHAAGLAAHSEKRNGIAKQDAARPRKSARPSSAKGAKLPGPGGPLP
ncbi:MAG: MaoC/PaaZ C-terminal domain-containing protein [Pirellulaceae bacterium]